MPVSPEISTLSDGLRVVTTAVPTSQSVSVNVFVGAGSRGEEERTSGLAHFLEHMVFKGTPRRPTAIDIAEAIEGAGGVLNAYTSKELTCYWNHVPDDRLETAIDVLADMLYQSKLEPEEIDRERSVVQQEIKRTKDQPGAFVSELLGQAVYGDHPMGWSTAGTEDTVGDLNQADFQDWLGTWYGASNIVVSVAGNATHEDVVKLASRYFGDGGAAVPPKVLGLNGGLPATRVISDSRPIAQSNLALGVPAMSRKDPDRYALMVLNSLLGRGMSSRLFKEVRERRGLAYSVGSSVSRYSDIGMLGVSAGVSPENVEEAVRVILAELEKLVEEPVGADELTKARDYTVGSFRLSLESPMSLGQRAGESLLTLGEIEPIETVVERLRAVTAEDISRVSQRLFIREKVALAVVGPDVEEQRLLAALAG
ncbi:MAG TPA: pitrilysin family protein [Dehalococcoidia bacterium]|nr:pitrilysin family protein [Dehalococcoidia bacterium]